jgi:hypothetical protein
MKKGSSIANDNEGHISIITDGVYLRTETKKVITSGVKKGTNRIASKTIYEDMNYANNKLFRIKVTPVDIQKDAYVDFYADDDDWYYSSVSNVHCGRIAVINTSKVGKRLTENIESLPKAKQEQKLPKTHTYNFPAESFAVANKYQDPQGMCFAISMARVGKAFNDLGIGNAIKVATSGDDYLYSGTVVKNIPDNYFGYGVGGALAKNGYAELLKPEEIWLGKMEEGAMIQYWNNPNNRNWATLREAIKYSIGKKREDWHSDYGAGHSVIFKRYIFDDNDNIIALWCYDYSGTQRRFERTDAKIFLGANLKDKK